MTKKQSRRRQPTFERLGRAYHLRIRDATDLHAVLELDDALWMALSAPTITLRADPVLLEHLDSSGDGQVTAADVRAAIQWLLETLENTEGVQDGNTCLELAAVAAESADGAGILQASRKILASMDSDAGTLPLEKVREIKEAESQQSVSDAGVVLPEATKDPAASRLIRKVLATQGGRPHPSGREGIDLELLENFLKQAKAHLAWLEEANAKADSILPLGPTTTDAADLTAALRPKIEEFFDLCDATVLDPELAARPAPSPEPIDFSAPDAVSSWLAGAFLSRPRPDGLLEFDSEINPYYAEKLAKWRAVLVVPILGGPNEELTRSEYEEAVAVLAPYEAWQGRRPASGVVDVPPAELRKYLANTDAIASVRELITTSHATALEMDNLRLTEKLILYQAWLLPLVNSFVSFPDLYDPESAALFEMGTLIIDGRHFTLSVKVLDRARHKKFSAASNVFILYVEVMDSIANKGKLYEVGVPVTAGGRGNLQVGQFGIFLDREGNNYPAQIVEMVENPISVSEAVRSPIERLGRAIRGRIEKMAAAADDKLETAGMESVGQVQTSVEKAYKGATTAAPTAPTAPAAPATATPAAPAAGAAPPAGAAPRGFGNALAGGGIAVAALGSSVAFISNTLAEVRWTTMVGVLFAAIVAALVPSTVIALLELQRRNLSALLEGSGWGLNDAMYLTRRQSRTFTFRPPYPRSVRRVQARWWARWWIRLVLWLTLLGLIGRSLYWLAEWQKVL